MIHLFALVFTISGFACLSLAMPRHQPDLLGRRLSDWASGLLRVGGFGCLLMAFIIDILGLGAAYGALAWFGHLTMGAIMAVGRLSWHSRKVAPAARPKR